MKTAFGDLSPCDVKGLPTNITSVSTSTGAKNFSDAQRPVR